MPNGSIHDLLHARSLKRLPPLPTADIQSLVRQILSGLAHLHQYHHMHRDMKPENILLCRSSCGNNLICKVADFSLARCCATEAHDPITSYVSTRWYRAPEVLLQAGAYGCPVDNFGLGCIVAEICRQKPLFAGRNEMDQLVTGTPASPHQSWNDGVQYMHKLGFLPQPPSSHQQAEGGGPRDKLEHFLFSGPTADNIATRDGQNLVDFVWGLLVLNPERRLTAEGALRHPYLQQQQQQAMMTTTSLPSATWTPANDKTSSASKLVTVSPAAVAVGNIATRSLQRRDIFSP